MQLLDLRPLAAARGFQIVGEYSHTISGSKAKRPGLDNGKTAAIRVMTTHPFIQPYILFIELGGNQKSLPVATHVVGASKLASAETDTAMIFRPLTYKISSCRLLRHDGSLELIERGCHRKAMFWIAGARSRCQKGALRRRARGTKRTLSFKGSYQEMVGNLSMASFAEIRRRSAEVKRILPRVWKLAEAIIAANQEIEHA